MENRQTDGISRKCFRCRYEDHLITKYTKPPKDNEKRQKQVCFNERGNRECDISKNNSDLGIYASMARMSSNDGFHIESFGDSSQLTYRIFASGATCHMTPEVTDFITGSLYDTDKYIEVA